MTVINLMAIISIFSTIIAIIGLKLMLKKPLGEPLVESFISLVSQSLNYFNKRLLMIMIQFFFITNIFYILINWFLKSEVELLPVLAFDFAILFFGGIIFILMSFFPNTISAILSQKNNDPGQLIKSIVFAGTFQNLSFFGCFLGVLVLSISFLNQKSFIGLCLGLIVASFYFRSAGGAYKAAAEHQESNLKLESTVLTHPSEILRSSGSIIVSVGGFYLDIFGSWFIAICGFFVFLAQRIEISSMASLLRFAEVKWVLIVVGLTGISTVFSLILCLLRKNKRNIFLEVGYFIIGVTFLGMIWMSYYLKLDTVNTFNLMLSIMVISMLGIVFFTNYLTSSDHKPIQFISRQAQFGSANVLISSFFNGLVGNAVFTLLVILVLVIVYSYSGLIGLMMIIIYGLSIIAVASNVKIFSIISDQCIQVLNHQNNPLDKQIVPALSKISDSLEAIGNAFSSVAGILASLLLFIAAFILNTLTIDIYSAHSLFGCGLGIVAINVFYAVSISGTYETLMVSAKEIQRQLEEIPHVTEVNKAHPNIHRLCDKHAVNGLKAVTFPGIWIIIALLLIYFYLSSQGLFSALIGMFLTVFIYSFFWSIFGDSVIAVFKAMRRGHFGGDKTSRFKEVSQSFLYAHYFQWVLAPTGVIIMKLAAIIALAITLN